MKLTIQETGTIKKFNIPEVKSEDFLMDPVINKKASLFYHRTAFLILQR